MTTSSSAPLENVWHWYRLCREAFDAAKILAKGDPDALPRNSVLSSGTPSEAQTHIEEALGELDDLVVLDLFAVFERQIIASAREMSDAATSSLTRPAERELMSAALSDVEEWRLVELLDVFKGVVDPDTVGLVKQVKKARDWVAHGKKGLRPQNLDPESARERLSQFLDELTAARREPRREGTGDAGSE